MGDDASTTPAAASAPAASPVQSGPAAPAAAADDNPIKDPKAFLSAYERMKAELAASKARLTEFENAQLSETQRLSKEKTQLQAELEQARQDAQDRTNRYEVELRASRLGIVDPEAAVKLLDWSSLEYGEDGTPKNVDAALKALLATKPYLAAQAGQAAAGATNPARGNSHGPLSIEDIRRMTPAQINANWREVQAVLAAQRRS